MKRNESSQIKVSSSRTSPGELATSRLTLELVKLFAKTSTSRINFNFLAPDRQAADALVASLRQAGDFDATIKPDVEHHERCCVAGSTEISLSEDVMDQFVPRMDAYANQHGCEFIGWGARVI